MTERFTNFELLGMQPPKFLIYRGWRLEPSIFELGEWMLFRPVSGTFWAFAPSIVDAQRMIDEMDQ